MSTINIKQKNAYNYMINSTTHNRKEEKYKNWNKEITVLYLGKESTDVGTEKEKMPV